MIDSCTRRGLLSTHQLQDELLEAPRAGLISSRLEVVRDAKRAVHATSHPLYPLFPKDVQRALPEGYDDAIIREPEMEPVVDLPADVQSPEELPQLVEAEDPDTARHVRSVLAPEAATSQPRTPKLQLVAVQGCRLFLMFDLAAQPLQKRARSADGPAVVE